MLEIEKTKDEIDSIDNNLKEKDIDNKAHDSRENEFIEEKVYIDSCEKCGTFLFSEAKALNYETREIFGCGVKIIKLDGKYLCPTCLIDILWQEGKQNLNLKEIKMEEKNLVVKEPIVMPAVSKEKAVEAFNAYQDLAKEIIRPEDIQKIQGKDFKKKSFWRKCQRFFNLSLEKIEERREEYNGAFTYHFVYRAIAPNDAYVDGTGSCSSNEKGLVKTEHIARATAETRAKNRAIADLVAFGEVSAEEITEDIVIEAEHRTVKEEPKKEKSSISLTISQALEVKEGTAINVIGILQNAKERQTKTKKDITDYLISDNSGNNKMTVMKWGHCHEGLKQGQTVIFKDVSISIYNDQKQYMAKEIEPV